MDNSHNNSSSNNNNNNNNNNNSHSSGEDSLYSSELKSSSNSSQHQQQRPKLHSPHRQRAMSFLHSISKRLGRRGAPKDLIYNSQDDIRSSSTDSFSLSLERGSGDDKQILSSNIDLSSDGHSSRSSSGSGSSHASSSGSDENNRDITGCSYKQHRHSYEPICYRSVSALEHDAADDGDDGDDDDSDKGDGDNNQDEHDAAKATVYKFCARTPLRGLNLNRISISTVSRVLQHISSSSSSSSTSVSTRSLSCNSTPLKCSKQQQQQQQSKKNDKKPASSVKSEPKKAAKPQPQQQRILRQPINYVYLKGMSGLPTRRVPRSSLCCSYGYR